MREFWVRLVSMLAIVGVLLGYNSVLDVRAKEDEIARLSAQVAGNGQSDSGNGGSTNYKDGTYTGEADGFGGTIQVEVKIRSVVRHSARPESKMHRNRLWKRR